MQVQRMRRRSTSEKLRSVALRFQHPLGRPRRPKQGSPTAHHRLSAAPEAAAPPAEGPCVRDVELARLEAVLLVAREPLPSRKLAQLASLADGTKARTLMRTLNRYYDQQGSAFRVEEVAGGLQLLSRPQFAPWLRRIQPRPVEVRLSAPALETLAVVAYRQPVLRADVEAVRGVQCGEILRQLIERDLVRIAGRSDELGRPLLYGTTRRFLQVFGLRSLEELPRAELLRGEPQLHETSTPDTTDSRPTPTASEPTEEKEVTTHIATANAETEPSETIAPPDDDRRDVRLVDNEDEFDVDDDEEDEDGDEDEEEYEDDEEYEDEEEDEDEDDDDEDEEEEEDFEDDFEDGEWEEVGEDDEEEEEEDEDDEDEDWDDDWDDDEWDDDDEELEEEKEDY